MRFKKRSVGDSQQCILLKIRKAQVISEINRYMCGSPDYNIPLKPFPSQPLKPYNSPLKPLKLYNSRYITKPLLQPLSPFYNSRYITKPLLQPLNPLKLYNIPLKPFLNNDPSKPLKPYNSPLKPLKLYNSRYNLTKPYNIPLKPLKLYNSPIYNQSTPFNQKQPNTPVKKKPRKKKPPRLPKIWIRIIRERTVKKKTSK
jgi:hypothetical protein